MALWLFYLRMKLFSKGWRYTSNLWFLFPLALAFTSITGLLKTLGYVEPDVPADALLVPLTSLLWYITLGALAIALIVDAIKHHRGSLYIFP